jgi:hypothetical protein
VVPFSYRPFDDRWLYWEPETSLLDRKREDYFPHVCPENIWLAAVQQNRKNFDPPLVSRHLSSLHVIERGANLFPLGLKLATHGKLEPNCSHNALVYLRGFGKKAEGVESLFYHIVSVLHAPAYRNENAAALRQDWPRIPLPAVLEKLIESEELGRRVAGLLQIDISVERVTVGKLWPELAALAMISREGGGSLDPEAGDLSVTAGWAHRGLGGAVMPSKGKALERDYTPNERAAIMKGAIEQGLSDEQAFKLLGERTFDVYLNALAYWKNIPSRVWEYRIGGYQVIKKWLSYRKHEILGRSLTTDEVHAVTAIARRIAAILFLEPKLDTNYNAITASTYPRPAPIPDLALKLDSDGDRDATPSASSSGDDD